VGTNTLGVATTSGTLTAPKLASAITSIPTTWQIQGATSSDTYDASFELSFSGGPTFDTSGVTSSGGSILIMLANNGASLLGSEVGAFSNAGIKWNVYMGTGAVTNGTYPVVTYVAPSSLSGTPPGFDLLAFIKDATTRSITTDTGTYQIKMTMYLEAVAAGFEVWSGGAGLQGANFSATVN
jgi:hypothetical protein